MNLESEVRAIVRDELAKLLATDQGDSKPHAISDLDRARARGALKRLGVSVAPEQHASRKEHRK